jgi:hypothetical protein
MSPSLSVHKTQLIWRGEETSYNIVQHFPSCVRTMIVGVAYSRSGVVVPAGPAKASENEIRVMKNCVAEGN